MAETYPYVPVDQDPAAVPPQVPPAPPQAPYTEIMGAEAPPTQPPAAMTGAMGGLPPEVEKTMRPPASTQEYDQRKAGWTALLEKFQNDPNLQRAVGMFGASLGQPLPPGQSNLGHFGQAYTVGTSAFEAGEYANRQQAIQDKELALKTAESGSRVAREGAATELDIARKPAVASDSRVAEATVQARIDKVLDEARQSALTLDKNLSLEEIDKETRKLKLRQAQLSNLIPNSTLYAVQMAEIEAALLKADEKRAEINQKNASAGLAAAQTPGARAEGEVKEITVEVLRAMNPEERKQAVTKTGKYAGHNTVVSQRADQWRQIYDGLPEADPLRMEKTKEQFVMQHVMAGERVELMRMFTEYQKNEAAQFRTPDPTVETAFKELMRLHGAGVGVPVTPPAPKPKPDAKGGASGGPVARKQAQGAEAPAGAPAAAAPEKWTPMGSTGYEQWERGPGDVVIRRKATPPPSAPVEAP